VTSAIRSWYLGPPRRHTSVASKNRGRAYDSRTMSRRFVSLLAGAGLATGISDGLFATVLSVFFYHSTFTRLWQGVAGVLIGKESFAGGTRTTALGLLMHFGVAFFWASVLLFFATRSPRLRDRLRSAMGRLTVAAVYGPVIWIVMSMIVIPL